jgi:hypothetical protein
VKTETVAIPPDAIREAGTDAVSSPELTNVVVSGEPFQRISEGPLANCDPCAVRVKADPPVDAEDGEIEVNTGAGRLGEGVTEHVTAPVGALARALDTTMACQPAPSWINGRGVPANAAVRDGVLGLHAGEVPGSNTAQLRVLGPATSRS